MKLVTSTFLFFIFICSTSHAQLSSDQIFESFKQGERTNCSSIAFIKASLNVYGLDNLFVTEKINDNLQKITLKNDASFDLKNEEINKAKISAGFLFIKDNCESEKIRDYAVLTYAVMAKYKQIIDKESTFDEALEDLEDGAVYTPTIYKYLGFKLGKQIQKLKRQSGSEYCGVVAWSKAHAVFVCEEFMDYYGNKKSIWIKYPGRFRIIKT
ncbi:hypothetical protein [Flavobacterium bizetiae]|uniref:Peptidase C39-like domain-containing protein n=1 Tax=Flavobacterium bizetiae TaxID=2704140 RepID=A0A6J4GXU9_9FLAO|nr:hypothetical protein [Flavobacterium bizetiae]UTN02751.1 hypothetical protein L0669_15610 [Flavobacterium bizetiae]CAA9203705.1 hypothetical protein FLA105534_04885 [Flavobacterium bizetiae]CAD5343093.1 hypothetical protein FLA105535_03091 [Flavobacterium bizetiae]CAD5346378.1 hypothetical protein FLA105534_00319 [Flavobacterium bizetiae]